MTRQREWTEGTKSIGQTGLGDLTYYVNPRDKSIITWETVRRRLIAQAVQDFRNNLGDPGWFAVALYLATALLGALNFQIA